MDTHYSEAGFWPKVTASARAAGHEVLQKALWLYYAAQSTKTPAWAKSVIYGALAYFVLPLDAIPDAIPVTGYSDDLGVLAAAVATVAMYIDRDVKDTTEATLARWFPERSEKQVATAEAATPDTESVVMEAESSAQ